MMRAMAARMPAMQSAVMQANSGSDTVRSSFTTTVRSGGTFPPVTTINNFVAFPPKSSKPHKNILKTCYFQNCVSVSTIFNIITLIFLSGIFLPSTFW